MEICQEAWRAKINSILRLSDCYRLEQDKTACHPVRRIPATIRATHAASLRLRQTDSIPKARFPKYVNNRSLQGYLLVLKKERCLAFGSGCYLVLGNVFDEFWPNSGLLLNLICNVVQS